MKFIKFLSEQQVSAPENFYSIRSKLTTDVFPDIGEGAAFLVDYARATLKHWDVARAKELTNIINTKNLSALLQFLPLNARKVQEAIDDLISRRLNIASKADLLRAWNVPYIESEKRKRALAAYTDSDIRWRMAMELLYDQVNREAFRQNDYRSYPK